MEHRTSARLQVILNEHTAIDVAEAFQQHPHLVLEALIDAFAFSTLGPNSLTIIQLSSSFGCAIRRSRQRTPYRLQALHKECPNQTLQADSIENQFYQIGGLRALAALFGTASDDKETKRLLDNLNKDEVHHFVKTIGNIEPHKDLLYIIETLKRGKSNKPAAKRKTKKLTIPGRRHRNARLRTVAHSDMSQGEEALPAWEDPPTHHPPLLDYPLDEINNWPSMSDVVDWPPESLFMEAMQQSSHPH